MCTKNHNHVKYDSVGSETDRISLHFWSFFAHPPPNNPENQKTKTASRDVFILYLCTKNDDDMMYNSWPFFVL